MPKKQPATMTDKKLATRVEGHEIQKPRLLDADHDREITARNDQRLVEAQAAQGIKEIKTEADKAEEAEAEAPKKG